MGEHFGKERVYVENAKVYIIRDVWAAPLGSEARQKTRGGRLIRCEYAVADYGSQHLMMELAWRPCVEGVVFEDIEPAFTISALAAIDLNITDLMAEA